MKPISLIFITAAIYLAKCQELSSADKVCVDNYLCCELKNVDGLERCARKCKPETACQSESSSEENDDDEEVGNDEVQSRFGSIHACKQGFQADKKGI